MNESRPKAPHPEKPQTGTARTGSADIWVWADLRSERLLDRSLGLVQRAEAVARERKGCAAIVFIESRPGETGGLPTFLDVDGAVDRAGAHGVHRVVVLAPDPPVPVRTDGFAAALAEAVAQHRPMLVQFPTTDFGKDLAARTAALAGAGLIADCETMGVEAGGLVADCPSWGGEILARITYADPGQTGFATVLPPDRATDAPRPVSASVRRISVAAGRRDHGLRLLETCTEVPDPADLEAADIVVVGGAGLGSMEGFGRVRELAAALGGQVGATRPPVLQHWVDENRLIGQTGKTVRPRLLVTVGTSGAIQYVAGITHADTIVAVNRDPHAPIFQVADVGVVQDAQTLLPLVTERVKRRVMRQMADMVCGLPQKEGAQDDIGTKIRKLREAHDWSEEHLATVTGQTPEYIQQVETGMFSPSVGFLLRLAGALKLDPGTFLGREQQARIEDRREREFTKRTRNYSYRTLTPGAENDHLRAFMVTIESRQAHKPVAYRHEGEEFVFVMEGELELTLDRRVHHLKPGESMHFNSETPHRLKSLSATPTRCLVVLYTI